MTLGEKIYLGGILAAYGALAGALIYALAVTWLPVRQGKRGR
jgi:hypothetical protein